MQQDFNSDTTHRQDSNKKQNNKGDYSLKAQEEDGQIQDFSTLGLKNAVLKGIKEAGFISASPVQKKAIPVVLEGKDLIAQAQTGTGKTAAFGLPMLNMLEHNDDVQGLVITPTRELAMQISDELFKLGKFLKARILCAYGGQSIKRQIDLLAKKPQIIIATPGRLLDHLKNNRIKNFNPKIVVLDEGDEMLDMGFIDDIEEVFDYVPDKTQILIFSATMPPKIKKLADKILFEPQTIKITPTTTANEDIEQRYYIINENERNDATVRLIDTQNPSKLIVFVRTKKEADELNSFLQIKGYKSVALHGDMDQRFRKDSINAFKDNVDILVATDIAARGLDISNVSHVLNYHIPLNPESYIHRIGRTGRAGNKGIAITLVTPLEYKDLKNIQNQTSSKLELYEIPSVSNDEAINKILNTKVSDQAIDFYENMKDKIDNAQLTLRLLSLYLNKNIKIGLTKQEVKDNMNKKVKQEYSSKRSRGYKDSSRDSKRPRQERSYRDKESSARSYDKTKEDASKPRSKSSRPSRSKEAYKGRESSRKEHRSYKKS